MEQPQLFGTDGVRGRANAFPMTVEVALGLGRAFGRLLLARNGGKHRVVVGKDTRLSCYMYENALVAGLCSMGVDTLMLGPLPTPGVAFITRAYRADAGIVISASHNPYYDNGIKFFSADGIKLPDSWERDMERFVASGAKAFTSHLPSDDAIGKNARVNDADGRYIEFVKGTFPRKLSLKGLRLALDCANGAGYKVAPLVFRELDADVIACGNAPNGLNINDRCGALHPRTIQRLVRDHKADAGIALDGDADRVIMVDEQGQLVDGDAILAICAMDMYVKGTLRDNKLVTTVMSNYGFIKAMEATGIEVHRSPVGDRYVIQEMLQRGALLGGEPSGHIIFSEYNTTGDGLVAALQVLRIMIESRRKLSDLAACFRRYPQLLLSVPVRSKPPLERIKGLQALIRQIEGALAGNGRVLVRYSGTEPICRVMCEGPTRREVERHTTALADCIKKQIGC